MLGFFLKTFKIIMDFTNYLSNILIYIGKMNMNELKNLEYY